MYRAIGTLVGESSNDYTGAMPNLKVLSHTYLPTRCIVEQIKELV
jgi:hypothetical protein